MEGLFWSVTFTLLMVFVGSFAPWWMTIILVPLPIALVCAWSIVKAKAYREAGKSDDLTDSELN